MRLLAVASFLALAASAAAEPPTTRPSNSGTLAQELEEIRRKHGVPALGAALAEDGIISRIAVVGTISAGSDEAVSSEDAWHIGSCAKAMTATLAARLVEQGKISWDTTMSEALPELAGEIDDSHKRITLRQLLGHRGGIIGHSGDAFIIPRLLRIEEEMEDRPVRERRLEAARHILRAKLVNEPGTTFEYSNFGYILAGAMLEAAGGASWEDLMRREVFEPLGMRSAGFGPPPRVLGHIRQREGWMPQAHGMPATIGPAGTVHVNMADWLRFASMHLGMVDGYLRSETIKFLHTPVPGGDVPYALGWLVVEEEHGTRLHHAGINSMWMAIIDIDLERREVRMAVSSGVESAPAEAIEVLRRGDQ